MVDSFARHLTQEGHSTDLQTYSNRAVWPRNRVQRSDSRRMNEEARKRLISFGLGSVGHSFVRAFGRPSVLCTLDCARYVTDASISTAVAVRSAGPSSV